MKLILTRDKDGIVQHVALGDVVLDANGQVELLTVNAVQITDKPNTRPIVGLELMTWPGGLELVQPTWEPET